MKIKTEELRRFLSASGQIKPNITAVNLDSIKIECAGAEIIFTKTNNHIWCKYSYVCQPQEYSLLLVNEKLLNGVALTSKEYEITLTRDGDNIIITSGEDVIKTKNQDIKLFPIMPTATGDKIKINSEVIERIRTASKYVNTGTNVNALNFVSIGMNGIFASNYNIVYYHNTFPLPEVLLDQEPLNTIKSTDDMMYWSSDTYNFFQADGFIFGFIKTAIAPIDYMPIINQTGTASFVCKREDLIDFCTLVQYSKRQENPLALLQSRSDKKDGLLLYFIDADFGIEIDRTITIQANEQVEQFKFNVEQIALMLKTIPYELLTFTKVPQGHLIITTPNDPDYKGIIARQQEQPNK